MQQSESKPVEVTRAEQLARVQVLQTRVANALEEIAALIRYAVTLAGACVLGQVLVALVRALTPMVTQ